MTRTLSAAPQGPCVRVRYMQVFAGSVGRLPEADRGPIRAAVSSAAWAAIDGGPLLGWLPLDVNLVCTRAVSERLGPERSHELFRKLLVDTARTPLLLGLVHGVLRVAVRDPGLYLPWISKGFTLMFQNAGKFSVLERRPGEALLELGRLPTECARDALWIRSAGSSLSGVFDIARLDGTVAIDQVNAAAARVIFRVCWSTRVPGNSKASPA
jgi:hypothetical protein